MPDGILIKFIKITAVSYLIFISCLFFFQDKIIFLPKKLDQNFEYKFSDSFDEIWIKSEKNRLNALHFRKENSKSLVIFLHGNYGNLSSWGKFAKKFLELGFNFLVYDYAGYGKSSGKIVDEKSLYLDAKNVLDYALNRYEKDKIIIVGYSIGSGIATNLACENDLKNLVLVSPYESLEKLAMQKIKIAPKFLVKFKIKTYEFIKNCSAKILIAHGLNDEIIPYDNTLNLAKFLKKDDKILFLKSYHNDILYDADFYKAFNQNFGY